MSGSYFALASLSNSVQQSSTAQTIASMATMTVKDLEVLKKVYEVSTSSYAWRWGYRAGALASAVVSVISMGNDQRGPFVISLLVCGICLALWVNISDKINNSEFWHGKCVELISAKKLQQS